MAVLLALFYAEEYWRGKLAWEQCKGRLEAQGERLDWSAYVPPAIPDEQNLAVSPALAFLYYQRTNNALFSDATVKDPSPQEEDPWPEDYARASDVLQCLRKPEQSPSHFSSRERTFTDLMSWQDAFEKVRRGELEPSRMERGTNIATGSPAIESSLPVAVSNNPVARANAAAEVLEDLKVYESILEGIRQAASQRPSCRYRVDYDRQNPTAIPLQHLARLKPICNVLKLRVAAELAAGKPEEACQNIKLMLRLTDSPKGEPWLICYLIRATMFRITADTVWEGLAQHLWSEAQLKEMQERCTRFDFIADAQYILRGERALHLKWFDYFGTTNSAWALHELNRMMEIRVGPTDLFTEPERLHPAEHLMRFAPRGWSYLEQRNYALHFQEIILERFSSESKRIEPARSRLCDEKLQKVVGTPVNPRIKPVPLDRLLHHRLLSALQLPTLGPSVKRAAETQTVCDQVTVACALERYRLITGNFPEQLQALVPEFIEKLPHDVITGKALIYRCEPDGGYSLYSVGWDEKDDGGVVPLKQSTTTPADWVWRMPGSLSIPK